MNPKQEVRFLVQALRPGTSQSGVRCPFCGGGRSAEKSLSITRRLDGIGLYICHRASCNQSGRVDSSGGGGDFGVTADQYSVLTRFKPKIFTGETRKLNEEDAELLRGKYGLTKDDERWFGYTIDLSDIVQGGPPRLLVPIVSQRGERIGYESKRIFDSKNGRDGSFFYSNFKSMSYREFDAPWMGWFYQPNLAGDNKVLIVEDVISAMRASHVIPTVALLGTGLNAEKMQDIVKITDKIILALDKDATDKAYVYKERWRFIAPNMQVINLDMDLKYLLNWEIEGLIKGVNL
jgi:hypothetical protein